MMELFYYFKHRRWSTVFGYALYIGIMAAGYFYNITFIQLGVTDLCKRQIGLGAQETAVRMAVLAILTLAAALLIGWWMKKTRRSKSFLFKLRLSFGVVTIQTILTVFAPAIQTSSMLMGWILLCSLALGVGMPATFGLTVDLIPRRDRGFVAGAITSLAYFASNVLSSSSWQMDHFRTINLAMMLPGLLGLGSITLFRLPFLETLAQQHTLPAFSMGRFVQQDKFGKIRMQGSWVGLLGLMFVVFFIDSLGFLRLLGTPLYMTGSWQSTNPNVHLLIAGMHGITGLIGGIFYTYLSKRSLFAWALGIFALTHLAYLFHTRAGPFDSAPLMMPMLYAIAVSLYTVLNFAIWADFSTPETISWHTALGVAFSGWSATFLSTALSMLWNAYGFSFEQHIQIVGSLALFFFLVLLMWNYLHQHGDLRVSRHFEGSEYK